MRSIFHSPVDDEEQRTEDELLNNMPDASHNLPQPGVNMDGKIGVEDKSNGRFIHRTLQNAITLTEALQHQWSYQTLKFVVYMHQISDGSHRKWACPIMLSDLIKYIVSIFDIVVINCSTMYRSGKDCNIAQGYRTLYRGAVIQRRRQRVRDPQMEQVYPQDRQLRRSLARTWCIPSRSVCAIHLRLCCSYGLEVYLLFTIGDMYKKWSTAILNIL